MTCEHGWRRWSRRKREMPWKAARRTSWQVGDRFRYNRWAETADGRPIEGSRYTVIAINSYGRVWFRADDDRPEWTDRKTTLAALRADVRRRLLVRIWED